MRRDKTWNNIALEILKVHQTDQGVEQAYGGINYATTKHSLRAALQLSPPDVQRSVTLNYSYLPVLVKLVTKYLR